MSIYILSKLEDQQYPLLGPNINALRFWGLILPENSFKKCLYIFLHLTVIIFTATEYAEIWYVKHDKNSLLTNLKITLLATVSVSKVTSFLIWQKHWIEIINYVTRADNVQRESCNNGDVINKYTRYSRKITWYYWVLMYTTVASVIIQPIYKYTFLETYRSHVKEGSEDYAQVVSSWVPFDKNTGLGHIFACIYQSYAAIYGGGWITSFDTNAIVIMVFFSGELKMLQYDSSKIFGTKDSILDSKESKNRLKNCHERYDELLKYSRLFDKCLWPIMFLYVIVCSIMICATAYQINIETSTAQKFITAEYLVFGVTQLFMYCWHCNEVVNTSDELSRGPYESKWWSRNISEQKNISILTYHFNKPIIFTAGPFTSVTIATLLSILKGAYSYYTLLNQTHN